MGPGTSFEIPVLAYEGCVLVYSFSTTGGDMGFGVTFKEEERTPAAYGPGTDADDDSRSTSAAAGAETNTNNGAAQETVLLAPKRYGSDAKEVTGTLRVARAGTLNLSWDNSFSYFTSKTLKYTVELEEPLGGPGGARPLGGPNVPHVVFCLGGPGGGKGTQCTRLAEKYGFLHVSAGDLLRAERNDPDSQHGALISSYIKEGKIVPVEITCALLWRAIRASARKFVLVDGFPRNQDNLSGWLRRVGERADVACVLSFDCPDDVLVQRLLERGKTSGRDDDNEESIRKRLAVFHAETEPIIAQFERESPAKVARIDANRDRDAVFADLERILKEKLGVAALPAKDEYVLAAPRSRLAPRVVFGTMTLGGASGLDEAASKTMLKEFIATAGVLSASSPSTLSLEMDTARLYGGGETEKVLGRIIPQVPGADKLKIATKVNPFPGRGASLSPSSVASQFGQSLAALGTKSVDVLYLHAPDPFTPLEQTLEACDILHRQGKFQELGLSNFASWQVAHAWHICASRGWVKPTVYQGPYSCLARDVERELIPCLRNFDIRFYAYNPLAGGLLTSGRYLENADEVPDSGRFSGEGGQGAMYRDRYWKSEMFAALAVIDEACRAFGVTVQDAALRWLAHHSSLRAVRGDGVIVGASSIAHLKQNVTAAEVGGPLPLPIVVAMETAWNQCKSACPKYFRP